VGHHVDLHLNGQVEIAPSQMEALARDFQADA
jgi:hypothetical protein